MRRGMRAALAAGAAIALLAGACANPEDEAEEPTGADASEDATEEAPAAAESTES